MKKIDVTVSEQHSATIFRVQVDIIVSKEYTGDQVGTHVSDGHSASIFMI
jgi:hypothetical protein